MAHFMSTIKGGRGPASRLGSAKSGMVARVNGWNSGVTVEAGVDSDGRDVFAVYATGGSNGGNRERIGTVVRKPFGSAHLVQFIPENRD
jgi:hypothetical protein